MKKFLIGIFALLLMVAMVVPVFAEEHPDRLVDDADILSNSEEKSLKELLDEISSKYNMDVAIITVESTEDENITGFTDDYYDYNGYSTDGIMLLLSMDNRKWHVSTKGYGIYAFTDKGQKYIMDKVTEYLKDNEYYDGFKQFAELADDFIKEAKDNKPYDDGHMPKEKFPVGKKLLIAFGFGFLISLIVNFSMKSKLKSVAMQRAAANYVVPGSMNITGAGELYLYSKVTATRKSSDSSSGGGSSTHSSSSGSTHGGSSGSF